MDISLAITRTSIFIFVYSLVLGAPFAIAIGWQEQLKSLLGNNWWIVPLVTSTILATAGPYIYLYIQRRAEERLLQEQHQYQNTLRRASLGMGRIKDLKRLLELIVHIVTRTVRLEHCSVYLFHEESNQFVLKACKGQRAAVSDRSMVSDTVSAKSAESVSDTKSIFSAECHLLRYINKIKEPIVYEEVKQKAQDYKDDELKEVEKLMRDVDAALVVPSFIEDRLIAIIVLGKKRSGKLYSHDDLVVFSILANQSALAIENAMFYEESKKTHEQLFKAEKMATIGTMADGLSHQINNRLHALGFIAGDALDSIKLAKEAANQEEKNKLFDEIEYALKRIEDNVKRGGEIVEGLLRYTRKGAEGFSPVELTKLLDASFEMLQFKIKLRDLEVIKNFDAGVPKIQGNFTQLQEVLFNIIDNSYDAMMQRKEELKEPDYKARLVISAEKKGKNLHVVIQDNGMGVREENVKKLFTPFFTTKLSSKKGTGLGLYVIRQIIEENHNGKVIFTSVYGQGSQTILVIPVAE